MELYSGFIQLKKNKGIDNYYYFNRGFNHNEIGKIETLLEPLIDNVQDGKVGTSIDKNYRSSQILWLPMNTETKWIYDKIGEYVNVANKELWNFDISGMKEQLQYGEYRSSENGHYDWHMDVGDISCNRKISVVIQLSDEDDYEGGELQFMTGKNIRSAPKNKGNVIIFPSFFLHRVTPVTKGVRKSLVIWVSGDAFR